MTPGSRLLASLLLAASTFGCSQAGGANAPDPGSAEVGTGRAAILGPFLAAYWARPIALQGLPPPGFSGLESSLDPQACGACHPEQLAQWRTSLHAGAYSPGFAGQLIEGSLASPRSRRHCQSCHAPLEEQQPTLRSGEPQPAYDATLRRQGIVCAACHVRAHRRFGPPRRAEWPAPRGEVAHGGFEAREEFQQARFCATCHQFFDQTGPSGKPLENTYVEWRESRHAAEGRTCQGCHMPDRAHTWRGIHDVEMVRNAVDVSLHGPQSTAGAIEATLELTNREVGHAFPSYVTPRVFLALWQADVDDVEIAGTRKEGVIGRSVDTRVRPARERFDSRVPPGGSFRLDYRTPRQPDAVSLHAQVIVDPAHHYRGVYERRLRHYTEPEALARMEAALRRANQVRYVLSEQVRALPR